MENLACPRRLLPFAAPAAPALVAAETAASRPKSVDDDLAPEAAALPPLPENSRRSSME